MASLILRAARTTAPRRTFATSAVRGKDFVQDLYLSQLKSYKAPITAADAHVGAVKPFQAPSAPQPPTSPSDFAAELATYETSEPTFAAAEAPKTALADGTAQGAKEYLSFLEQDLPKPDHHH